jgi:hypothetical protein
MNSATISLIMLLMERENEIENFPSDEIDRYDNDTLIDDFEELGFDAVRDMNVVVEEMTRRDLCITYNISLITYQKTFNYILLVAIKYNICHTFLKNQSIGGWYGLQKNQKGIQLCRRGARKLKKE